MGRTAIVTGAARGIGAAIARRLAADGADVAVVDLDGAAAELAAAQIRDSAGVAFSLQVDVADPVSVGAMVRAVVARAGRIDILVNNAGILGAAADSADYAESEWRRVLAIDLDGVFYCTRAVLPEMLARGSGRVVNIASVAGKEGNPRMPAYSAAKAGVIGLTKALGKELATKGVFVNCVTPAVIETGLFEGVSAETMRYMVSKIPMERVGRPEEVAAMVAWLCSDECSFTTGAVFDISGGRATY